MKKISLSVLVILLMTVACKKAEDKALDTTAVENDTIVVKEVTSSAPMDSIAIQKAWEAYMTPGDVHKMLANDTGTWNEEVTVWMAPGAEPTKNKMVAVSKMVLGGRYQETKHTGNFMGMPFEGIAMQGYDNASQKMVSSWVDNMGTGIMYMSGDYDGSSKTIEFKGEMTNPITKKIKPTRELFTMVDDNTRKTEIFDITDDGKEYKKMEIIMTRKK